SSFRTTLEEFLKGNATQEALEASLAAELRADPRLAPATMALLEAYRRTSRVAASLAERVKAGAASPDLIAVPRAPTEDRTRLRAPTPPGGGVPPPVAPAAPAEPPADRTVLRPRAAPTPAPTVVEPAADKTVLKPRPAPTAAIAPAVAPAAPPSEPGVAAPVEPAADKTVLKPRRPAAAVESPSAPVPESPSPQSPPPAAVGPTVGVDAVSADSPRTSGTQSQNPRTSGTSSSTSSWNSSSWSGSQGASTPVGIGTVLKERYVLESIVAGGDKGGMGLVFRARDLINEEAQDRNPFVAVKILNDEFKRHPESVLALQREARKSQNLAHPNIITVFTFDRDQGNFFIVMELLEGSALNDVIKNAKDKGLPKHEALRIIQALARALAYAHERRIVHSDFKPSNAFLTNEGNVKVLDFGIARATKTLGADGKSKDDKTLFDAATLGAFTPPYASCEQIEGKDPDERDDVYALAIVSYELLTGRHPFERKDAVTARDEGLKPAVVGSLSRSQWRTLQSALSFSRAKRPANGLAYGEGMTPKRLPIAVIVSSGAALLLFIAAAVIFVPGLIEGRRAAALSDDLNSTTAAVAAAALQQLQAAKPSLQASVLSGDANRRAVVRIYEARVRLSFDPRNGRYDFAAARKVLDDAHQLLSDSATLDNLRANLEKEQKSEINARTEQFEDLLKRRVLLAAAGQPSVVETRGVVRQLDPAHPLLKDTRVPIALRDAATAALSAQDALQADKLRKLGLEIAPTDPNLRDLVDQVSRARESQTLQARTAELERSVAPLAEASATLASLRAARVSLDQLRTASASSAVLARVQRRLEALIGAEVSGALQQNKAEVAQSALAEFEPYLAPSFLQAQRNAVTRVVGEAQAKVLQADQLRHSIDTLLAAPRAEEAWAKELRSVLAKLNDVSPRDARIADAEQRASRYVLDQSRALRTASRFSEAERLLDIGATFHAGDAEIAAERSAIKRARDQLEADNQVRGQQAKLAADKQRVLDLAGAGGGQLDRALAMYRELEKQLPAGDSWAKVAAPQALADGYLRRALSSAQEGQFTLAQNQARSIQSLTLTDAKYAATAALYDGYANVAAGLQSGTPESVAAQLTDLQRKDAKLYDGVRPALARILSQRITKLAVGSLDQAQTLKSSAEKLFPKEPFPTLAVKAVAAPRPAPVGTAGSPEAAHVEAPAPAARVETPVEAPRQTAAPAPSSQVPAASGSAAVLPSAAPVAARPCTAELAGKGAAGARASCFDSLSIGARGPELVVIVFNGRNIGIMRNEVANGDYAKFCATTGCTVPAAAMAGLPVASVTAGDATRYADWLTQQTGNRYRLPSDAEWLAAAGSRIDANGVNCVFGPRGSSVREVGSGTQNEFGLRDMLGNVREWVAAEGGSWRARGGAYGDPLEDCLKIPATSHSGSPDGRTGFRLVREMK
ncbi:MAG: protein kinase, partial [Proteobacteria bacterium]|nr:protein kinase [Pseudomonadota bacterium]